MPDSISHKLFERALKRIPGGVNSPVRAFRNVGSEPFFVKKADGAYLTDADGHVLIDYVCTWGPAIHGHNDPDIRAALQQALENGTSFGMPSEVEVEMAQAVCERMPSVQKVRMCNSGTEATMSCLRLARGFTGREKIVKFAGCYHGHADALLVKAGSGALTGGHPDSAGVTEGTAKDTIVAPYNDREALEAIFKAQGDQIAGLIVEAYPANVGLILPDEGFLQFMREICTRYGALFIFDEVMTGFRISRGGVQEKARIQPDLTAMGKVIGGGLPVGAFGGRAEIMDLLAPCGPVYQAGTLSGNPLAMSAGLASLRKLDAMQSWPLLNKLGEALADGIRSAAEERGIPLQVPQAGSLLSIFFAEEPVRNYQDVLHSQTDLFAPVFRYALGKGVFFPPSPFESWFISTAHTQADIDRTLEVVAEAFKKAL